MGNIKININKMSHGILGEEEKEKVQKGLTHMERGNRNFNKKKIKMRHTYDI
jgi:hypothetical protein